MFFYHNCLLFYVWIHVQIDGKNNNTTKIPHNAAD